MSIKSILLIVLVLLFSHVAAWLAGGSMQRGHMAHQAHAHLSDVGDAITLGEYFVNTPRTEENTKPAQATWAVIYRILGASTPGPNSTKQLETLQAQLREKYYAESKNSDPEMDVRRR